MPRCGRRPDQSALRDVPTPTVWEDDPLAKDKKLNEGTDRSAAPWLVGFRVCVVSHHHGGFSQRQSTPIDTPPGTPPGTPPDMPAQAFGSQMLSTMNGIGTATASVWAERIDLAKAPDKLRATFPKQRVSHETHQHPRRVPRVLHWLWFDGSRGFGTRTGRTVCKCADHGNHDLDRSSPFHRNAHDFGPP